MATDHKHELVDFLVRAAFDPILKARPDGPEADKKALQHVQEATRSEIDRYNGYGSAEEVVINFRRDLTSIAAKKVHTELERLKLPTLRDVREQFEGRARSLGVNVSS